MDEPTMSSKPRLVLRCVAEENTAEKEVANGGKGSLGNEGGTEADDDVQEEAASDAAQVSALKIGTEVFVYSVGFQGWLPGEVADVIEKPSLSIMVTFRSPDGKFCRKLIYARAVSLTFQRDRRGCKQLGPEIFVCLRKPEENGEEEKDDHEEEEQEEEEHGEEEKDEHEEEEEEEELLDDLPTPRRQRKGACVGTKSQISDEGVYLPGSNGMVQRRARNAEALFAANGWKLAQFRAHKASWRFFQESLLRFGDLLGDGFRARFSAEILLVQRDKDEVLLRFMEALTKEIERQKLHAAAACEDPPSDEARLLRAKRVVRLAARAVVEVFGGLQAVSAMARVRELGKPPPQDILLGELMGGPGWGVCRRGKAGAGCCRHRAILLKYALDALSTGFGQGGGPLCEGIECALLSGVLAPPGAASTKFGAEERAGFAPSSSSSAPGAALIEDHMWNVVRLHGQSFLVDCAISGSQLRPTESIVNERAVGSSYHRIGGGAGMKSLGGEELAKASGGRGRRNSSRRSSLEVFKAPEASGEDWFELLKCNLESFGDVEVYRPSSDASPCPACDDTRSGPVARILSCGCDVHVACLLEAWASGMCPACGAGLTSAPAASASAPAASALTSFDASCTIPSDGAGPAAASSSASASAGTAINYSFARAFSGGAALPISSGAGSAGGLATANESR